MSNHIAAQKTTKVVTAAATNAMFRVLVIVGMVSLIACQLESFKEMNHSLMNNWLFSQEYFSGNAVTEGCDAEFLPHVEKPARYVGNEVNQVNKDLAAVRLRMALAFPDVYEVGMSHLGLKILYSVVNHTPDLYAERVFAPWTDLEALLRQERKPLATLETGTPLSEMDFIGFSLQYELCGTNVLQMLDLGGIPLRAQQRRRDQPLVVGGGPGALNPAPFGLFFDAFVLGEGEEVILEMAYTQVRWKEQQGRREDLLHEWKKIPGVFVPSLHQDGEKVSRRVVADLDGASFPTEPVVPFCEPVHDRVGLEIARGCTRGCRFCQAGMVYRPVREKEPQTVLDLACRSIAASGWEEIALLSLSSGDYTCIGELIGSITRDFARDKVALSLPSLRTDSFSVEMAEQIRKVRKTGFTLAPEAGTERLRRVINKGNTEEDLERAITAAFEQGWNGVKLYFMIGLPFETDEDLDGIVGLVRKASKWAKGGRVTASVSTFVPKSHTPFQWCAQISMDETARRQQYIRRYFQRGKTRVKVHDPRSSFLEGVIARGDERLAEVMEAAYEKGARFDGWNEHLNLDVWMEAFEEMHINPNDYLKERHKGEGLPWDYIDTGIDRDFLVAEWERAEAEERTEDCRNGDCAGCGVCDFEEIHPRLASVVPMNVEGPEASEPDSVDRTIRRFRLRYGKFGPMRFLGHHDVTRVFHRAFRRASLQLDYSKGFHPHPRMRFSPPLGLGIESLAEYVDFDLVNCPLSADEIETALARTVPRGLQPLDLIETSLNESAVSGKIRTVTYDLTLSEIISHGELMDKLRQFASSPTFEITKMHKGKTRTRDLKEWVRHLDLNDSTLRMTLSSGPSGSVNPYDALSAILGMSKDELRSMKLVKASVEIEAPRNEDRGPSHG